MSLPLRATSLWLAAFLLGGAERLLAQPPAIAVPSTVVAPGQAVTVTVTGTPGEVFALLGSTTNAGLTHAGVTLSVGVDFRVLAIGALDPSGLAAVDVTPPFLGTTLDRYYLQAATSTTAAFVTISPSAGVVLVNADLANNLERPAMHSGVGPPPDDLGLVGDMYFDASTRTLYGPKVGTSWAAGGVALGTGSVFGIGGGPATLRARLNWGSDSFDVLDFAWGAYRPPPVVGGGAVTRAALQPLTFTRIPDGASARLLKAAGTGTHVPTATLVVTRTDTQQAVYTLTLTDVGVSNYDQRGDRESVALQGAGVVLTTADPLPYPPPPATRASITFPGRAASDAIEAGTGVQNSGVAGSGAGARTGRAQPKAFSVTRNPDGFSDDLVRMITGASGGGLSFVETVLRDAVNALPYIRHRLGGAFLASFTVKGSATGIEESLGFSYDELRTEMTVNGVMTVSCFNFKKSAGC